MELPFAFYPVISQTRLLNILQIVTHYLAGYVNTLLNFLGIFEYSASFAKELWAEMGKFGTFFVTYL